MTRNSLICNSFASPWKVDIDNDDDDDDDDDIDNDDVVDNNDTVKEQKTNEPVEQKLQSILHQLNQMSHLGSSAKTTELH